MTFFPSDYDPRDIVSGVLDLCLVDTTDGPARFLLGTDGRFTDTNGDIWYGSQLIGVSSLAAAIGGDAPEGNLTFSFFQDPDADDLITELRAQGLDYVKGRDITFYVQPVRAMEEFYAPTSAPIQWMVRTMRTLTYVATGAQNRSISVSFEAWSENRKSARKLTLNTNGHATLIGEANVSLSYMPTDDFEEDKLFG